MTLPEGGGQGVRVAVVVDGATVPAWQAEAVARLVASPAAAVVLLVSVVGGAEPGGRGGPGAAVRLLATRVSKARALVPGTVDSMAGDVPTPAARLERGAPGGDATLSGPDLAAIRASQPDVVLWLAEARPSAAVVDTAPRGLWRFQFGDGAPVAPTLIGGRELLSGEAVVAARLLAERHGAPPVALRTGAFAVDPMSWARTRNRVLLGVGGWAALACRAAQLGALEASPVPVAAAPGPGPVGTADALRLVIGMWAAIARRLWHHGFRHDDWNVGVVDAPVASFLAAADHHPRVDWAPVRGGHYAADPFGRWDGDTLHVLYEDFVHARGVASLAHRRWRRDTGWLPASPMLDIGTHQSYPFLLEHDGRLWLLPESRAGNALVLYAAERVDGPWRPAATLDVPGDVADATPVRHDGRWWLFAIRADRLNPATELGLWFADRPEGPWQEHPLSPVLADVRSARPGGPLFVVDGQLYRPAQDCSTGYGDRLAIKRVTALTPERYAEELVRVVRPDPGGEFAYGLHTLTAVGPVTLVDGKRRVRDWGAIREALARRLRR
jgi:hypothetical protein